VTFHFEWRTLSALHYSKTPEPGLHFVDCTRLSTHDVKSDNTYMMQNNSSNFTARVKSVDTFLSACALRQVIEEAFVMLVFCHRSRDRA